ncbi:uncharacterized protein LOC121322677 [Polyodon spathula]|uniref:uncharacterized protein LOC121322677 n=1 Tax=Polyodon spathula TaxID=7913 RepID=UPI001B7DE095|nr:uncharacterized protein LOC121322677 [Polyodon spathula]
MEAKWLSIANHIQNIHTHDSELFPRCIHSRLTGQEAKKMDETRNSNNWSHQQILTASLFPNFPTLFWIEFAASYLSKILHGNFIAPFTKASYKSDWTAYMSFCAMCSVSLTEFKLNHMLALITYCFDHCHLCLRTIHLFFRHTIPHLPIWISMSSSPVSTIYKTSQRYPKNRTSTNLETPTHYIRHSPSINIDSKEGLLYIL